MNVVIKKSILESFLKRIVEDRGGHSVRIDQIAGDAKPIIPDEQVATQLSQDNVPVEDPNFLPVNKKQLKNAASQMADKIEPEKIQKFYSMMKRLVRKNSEKKDTKVRELELMEALSSFILKEAKRQQLQQFTGTETDDEEVEIGKTPTKNLMKVKAPVVTSKQKTLSPQSNTFTAPEYTGEISKDDRIDAEYAADDIVGIAIESKLFSEHGDQITITDPKTKETGTFNQTATRTTDDIDNIISSLFNRTDVNELFNDLTPASQSLVPELIKSKITPMLASRVPISDYARGFANAILDMISKNVDSKGAFESTVDTVSASFSITADNVNVPVKIPGVKTPYNIEVPKDIDPVELDKQIKSALSTKKTTFWDNMQPEEKLVYPEEPAEDDASSEEVDDEEKIKSDLQIMSDETGIPVGSLRNLSSDFAYIFGEKEKGTSSPKELSGSKLHNYVNIAQIIYDSFIGIPGREVANKTFKSLSPKQKAKFASLMPKEKGADKIKFGDTIFDDDFFDFIDTNPNNKEDTMNIIDSFISGLIKSEQFEGGYPEFIEFRNILKSKSGTPFSSTKDISATESRLGLTDINSLARFTLGFDLVYKELESRCFDYLSSQVNATSFDNSQLGMLTRQDKSELKSLLDSDKKTNKFKFKLSVSETKEKISEILSAYAEPNLLNLENVIIEFIENIPGGLKSKRDAFIAKIIDLYTDAINN